MKKTIIPFLFVLFIANAASAQELFRYGSNTVGVEEFMRNYNRNNAQAVENREASLKENLELYIRYKLKVKAAYDLKYDTLPSQRDELRAFRRQIENNYLKDDKVFNDMVQQAFDRMQKDIRVSHIIVMLNNASKQPDTMRANKKLAEIMARLKAGEDFGQVAAALSEDPSAAENRGDIGYITVFSLPWEMENAIYATAPGKYSTPYRSSFAWHIFKNTGERKAMGKMKAAQILVAYPPNADDNQKRVVAEKAENLYNRLGKGELFDNLARSFSDDYISAQAGGTLAEFGTGKYDPVFENTIYNLKEGEYSRPFKTNYGYHIVKRLGSEPVPPSLNDAGTQQMVADLVRNDARNEKVKDIFVKSILSKIGYREQPLNKKLLFTLTDSVLAGTMPNNKTLTEKTGLHKFTRQDVKVGDFWKFVQAARQAGQYRDKNAEGLLPEYVKATALEYYRDHLEEYDAAFRTQLNEFKDGNLLFEAMERNIWAKSGQDTLGLLKYYRANKPKYIWDASADALVFTVPSKAIAEELQGKLKKNISAWRDSAMRYGDNIISDSNRYLLTDLPVPENTRFTNEQFTAPIPAGSEGAYVFCYIVRTYAPGGQRSFDEARGFVINDYQHQLEEDWIAALKKKYPVVVNNKAWEQVLKSKK